MTNSMDRRGFLKAMGVLLGMAVLPSALVNEAHARILPPQKPKPAPKPIEQESMSDLVRKGYLSRTLRYESIAETRMLQFAKPNSVYVGPKGNDISGQGTLESPYATINRAIKEIKQGGVIRMKSGVYMTRVKWS